MLLYVVYERVGACVIMAASINNNNNNIQRV